MKAKEKYSQIREEIKENIKLLLEKLDEHNEKQSGNCNWGHVGDISHINSEIKDLLNSTI